MTFDYKKEYKEFYMPKGTPSIVTVPKINYIAVRGSGNPNDADGEYKQAIGLLYGIAFTIKMSKKEDHQIDGYFDYVVPPLEGFWWQGERRPGDAMLRTDRAGRRDGVSGTVDAMHRFMEEQGYTLDITDQRMHHEIYLSDVRKVAPEKLKTVIRHPIKRA